MILVAAVVVAAALAGALTERRNGAVARRLATVTLDVMLYALVPFVVFFNIARLHITAGVGAGLGLAYLELAVVGVLAWAAGRFWLRLSRASTGALICAVVLVNTGYLGLPMSAALLGSSALRPAIAFDALVSGPMLLVVGFAVGAAFGTHAGAGRRQRVRAFLVRNPPLLAVVAALVAPAGAAPDTLVHVSRMIVYALLVLGFYVLGIFLMTEAQEGSLALSARPDPPTALVLGLRLLIAPALMIGLSDTLVTVPDAYLLQAAMPCGINSLLVAHAYGLDLRLTAGAVAWSTLAVVAVGVAAAAF